MKRALFWMIVVATFQVAQGQNTYTKALGYLQAGDTSMAVTGFQQALKAGQNTAESNYYLGAIAVARHQPNEAVGYLQSAVKLDDENADARKALGDAYMQLNDVRSALLSYRGAAQLAPHSAAIQIAMGTAQLAIDSVDAAIVTLTRAKEFDPSNPEIYVDLAECYLKQNVIVLAITNYQKAIELSPKTVSTHLKLATAYFKNRQYNEAVKEYDEVLSINPSNMDALLAKGRIYVLAKLYRQAIPPLQKYVGLRPKSVEGQAYLARAFSGVDDYAEASKAAASALRLDSSDAEIWRVQAYALTELKDANGAMRAFAKLKALGGFKQDDLSKYGAALFLAGREDEALKTLLDAVSADSTNCDPYFDLGYLYMRKQDYDNAAKMFEKKIACDPRSLSSYVNAAASYMQSKNFARAGELLHKAVELQPSFLQARLWLARYYTYVDSLDKAMQEYDEVLRIIGPDTEKYRKDAGEAYGLKGSGYFYQRYYRKAIESFRTALSLGYETAGMQLSWGEALLQLLDPNGDPAENQKLKEESIRHLRRSVEKDDKNPIAHLWLAQALLLSRVEGKNDEIKRLTDEACGEYKKVLRLDPHNDDAKKGMVRIGCK